MLLTTYGQLAAQVLAARADDDRQVEKLGRLLIAYGRALRLNPMQTVRPKAEKQGGIGITWRQLQDDDDDGAEVSRGFRAGGDDDDGAP